MINKTILGYTILSRLGESGMVEVYYAENKIHKKAAVKFLKKKFCDDESIITRFQNEAEVMVALDHPNIRQVFDYAELDGQPAIIQEYLEGNDLKSLIKSGKRFSDAEMTKLWNDITDALNYTHSKGIVHRDIKPSNIFITERGVAKILDFGIAKTKGAVTGTQTGWKMGTLLYMSPEQVLDSKQITSKSDIYSLAVTFVSILTGKQPYDEDSSSDYVIMDKIVHESLDMAGVPEKWSSFLNQYLAKDPSDRPGLKHFSESEETVDETSIEFSSDSSGFEGTIVEKPDPKPKKKNLTWLWILLVVVVLGGGFAIYKSNESKKIAEQQRIEQQRLAKEQQDAADNAFFQNCSTIADYRVYLNKYPNGLNKELAKNKINKHIADSTAKANEAERQRQIAAENERKAREEAARFKNKTFTVNGVSFEMVAVKGGTFTMGATSEQGSDADYAEKPTHSVTLSDYYIGKFEVTQELWQAVMGSNPSNFNGNKNPVEQVSWDDCQDFIRKLNQLTGQNFRLPTEAEWEYAARGGNKSKGYKYSGSSNIVDVAWFAGNSGSKTHTVGTKSPNELGIYDMSGNVSEWCQDWYGDYGSGSQTNPKGASSGSSRVLRGGGWSYFAQSCRVSYRDDFYPDYGHFSDGFRLVQ